MCGIIGYFGKFSKLALERGLVAIRHRGPDDQGIYSSVNERVCLGHVRLAILDLSPAGHQPMISADGNVVLVYNGELYNYIELRDELVAAGEVFHGHSDTEVLLRLYLREGQRMLSRLNGIFAFALWDARQQAIFMARDALGVKPLYYHAGEQGVAFCSEIKGLCQLLPGALTLNHAALARYGAFLYSPGAETPVREIRKVLPGEALELRDGVLHRRWQWYSLPSFQPPQTLVNSVPAAISGTLEHLRRAVHRQLVSDVPVGVFLSGGLDSSAILALAVERQNSLQAFTIACSGFADDGFTDDEPFATQVAKHFGVPLHSCPLTPAIFSANLCKIIEQLDEPVADPAALNVLLMSQMARDQGVKVILSGTGGDDLFSGYFRHFIAHYGALYGALVPAGCRRLLARGAASLDQKVPRNRRLARLLDMLKPTGDRRLAELLMHTSGDLIQGLFHPDIRAAMASEHLEVAAPLLASLREIAAGRAPLERLLALEQRFFLPDLNFLYMDKMAMACGVEVRVPFLDTELVAFANTIPTALKMRRGCSKWVLRQAVSGILPQEIISRPKTGFGLPLRSWMQVHSDAFLEEYLSPETLCRRGLFDPIAVQQLRSATRAGSESGAFALLALASIEIWCHKFLDK